MAAATSTALRRRAARVAWFAALMVGLPGCATTGVDESPTVGAAASASADLDSIIVAVDETPEALPGAGTTPRSNYGRGGYAGSTRSAATAAEVALEHGLRQQASWSIAPLKLRCMLYRIEAGADRASVLAQVARDPRVRLAQPLNRFETLAAPLAVLLTDSYNDPYVGLQRGFAAINAAGAQRWSRGNGVRVALIDSGVDSAHPDLAGRIASQRDFVARDRTATPGGERHGTQTAGVITAGANNRIGIVGIAPQARLLAYRACWPVAGSASRCDTFTLAQALGAAIAASADVINLSLGGPADPLLQRLAEYAIDAGAIIVGAVPPSGRLDGFPVGVPGVLAVASSDAAGPAGRVLFAPGRDILTLAPGGHYDYASGNSLAAAHVSGAVALLRALDPGLRADTARAWLEPPAPVATPSAGSIGHPPIDVCAAVHRLRAAAVCALPEPVAP